MVGDSPRDMAASAAAGCLFSVAIHRAGEPLPVALTSAACRVGDIEALVPLLADAGMTAFGGQPGPRQATQWSIDPTAAEATSEQVVAPSDDALKELDPEIVKMVEAMAVPAAGSTQRR